MTGYKRVLIDRFGGPELLHVVEEPALPEPGAGEVRLRIVASGVGYTDTIVRRGKYVEYRGGVPMTPGYDVVGTVDAVGDGVGLKLGTMVADMTITGGYAQYLIRPAAGLVPVPAGVNPTQAVCVPLIWMTAWQMLTRYRTPAVGETILVVGAAGSTGRALVALAQHLGLKVVGSCSSHDMDAVRESGAAPVDYRTPDLPDAIRRAARSRPITMAFDAAAGKSWESSWVVLARGGVLVSYGAESFLDEGASLAATALQFTRLMLVWNLKGRLDGTGRRAVMYNINARRKKHGGHYREDAAHLLGLIATTAVSPAVEMVLPLSGAAEAHRRIDRGGMSGRIVLDPWMP